MGLYESLDEAVGASLLACAPAVGCPMPPRALLLGGKFSAFLRARGEAEGVGGVLDAMAREIWLSQDTRGITLTAAEEHALLLPKALDACRPDADEIAQALTSRRGTHSAARISGDVIGRAIGAGVLSGAGRTGEICQFLLEKTLELLLQDPDLLNSLTGAFEAFAAAARPSEVALAPASRENKAEAVDSAVLFAAPASREAPQVAMASPDTSTAITAADSGSAGALDGPKARYEISEAALARLSELLERRQVPASQRPERLEELTAWITAARAHLLQPTNEPAQVRSLNEAAAAALAQADFVAAEQYLSEVRKLARESRRGLEKRLRDELASLEVQQREEADAIAGLAELALACHEYDTALALFVEAAQSLPLNDREGALRFGLWSADCLLRKGKQGGQESALMQAAQAYADALQQARMLGDKRSEAIADLGIGRVLMLQAERAQDPGLLDDAVKAMRRSLATLAPGQEPSLRAEALVNIGDALALLGGPHLAEAAEAFRQTLPLIARNGAPLRWALTQVKLGGTLVRMAESSGERRLWLAAAQAMFAALDVFEGEGAEEHAELTRRGLRRFHDQLPAALAESA